MGNENPLQQLLDREYPESIVKRVRTRADHFPRQILLRDRQKTRDERIMWAIDYTPCANQVRKIVRKHWHFLQDIPGCQLSPQVGMHRTKSIRNIIIRSDVNTVQEANERRDTLPVGHF